MKIINLFTLSFFCWGIFLPPAGADLSTYNNQTSYEQNAIYNKGGKTTIIVKLPASRQQQLKSHAQHELSAIGVKFHRANKAIYYIDSNSDLTGKVELGDRLLTINGVDTNSACDNNINFGNEQSLVDLTVLTHKGQFDHLQCYRHPIAYFSPSWKCFANDSY